MSEGATNSANTNAATGQGGESAAATAAANVSTGEAAAAESTEAAATETAESETEKKAEAPVAVEGEETKKEKKERVHHEYMRKHHPDHDYADSDATDKLILDRFTSLDSYQEKMKTANDSLVKIFRSDPVVRKVLTDMTKGAGLGEALSRHMDLSTLVKAEGDPDFPKWDAAKKDRLKKLADQDERNKVVDTNREQSIKDMGEFFKANDISDEAATEFAGKIDAILQDVFDGKITKEFLGMMQKGIGFDKAVQDAAATGEIKAKNEKIETMKVDAKKEGDGLPELTSKNIDSKDEKQPELDPFAKSLKQNLERNKNMEEILGPGNTE